MSEDKDRWDGAEDEVVRRLREEKPQLSAFELDHVKTAVMAKARPSASGSRAPRRSMRSRFLVAALTLGLMAGGTAGAVAAGGGFKGFSFFGFGFGSGGGTSAVTAQYTNPCRNAVFPLLCECRHHPAICYCLITGFLARGCPTIKPNDVSDRNDTKLSHVRAKATQRELRTVVGSRGSPDAKLYLKGAKAVKGR
jgi:hypothetical protein